MNWAFIPMPFAMPSRASASIAPSRCVRPSSIPTLGSFARLWINIRGCAPRASYQMIRDRGYSGSVVQLRRAVARLRPQRREAFLQLQMFPGEQAQVDWAHFGQVMVGRAKRALSCFVMTLSYSRALYLEFFFDQTMENFLRGHVHAFAILVRAAARDSLRQPRKAPCWSAAATRSSFNPRLHGVERALSLRSAALPGARGQSERARGARHPLCARFVLGGPRLHHAGRMQSPGAAVARQVAHQRRWPGGDNRTVAEVFAEERPRLLPPAAASVPHRPHRAVRSRKTIYVRFDLNDYSIPPRSRGPAVDPGGLRYRGAHSRWRQRDRPPCTHLRSPPTRARSRASGGRAEDQAQGLPLHARRPFGAGRAREQDAARSGLRARRIGRLARPRNC